MDVKSGADDDHKSKEAMEVSPTADDENAPEPEATKRNASEVTEGGDDVDEDNKRKKRKDSNGNSTGKSSGGRNAGGGSGKCTKSHVDVKSGSKAVSSGADRKSPSNAGGPSARKGENEGEASKPAGSSDGGTWAGGLKVPPLKIVIPQQSSSSEQDRENRTGKTGAGRHHLPYVVTSTSSSISEPVGDKELTGSVASNAGDEKKDGYSGSLSDDQRPPRILRSSHRSSTQSESSPAGASSSGSPEVETGADSASPPAETDQPSPMEVEPIEAEPTASTSTATTVVPSADEKSSAESSGEQASQPPAQTQQPQQQQPTQQSQTSSHPVQVHPRKRKIKQNRDNQAVSSATTTPAPVAETPETSSTVAEPAASEPSVSNSYQSFRNIRKQVDRRRKGLFPVQPKPPSGFKDYLMNRCTYLLAGNAANCMAVSMASPPPNLQPAIKNLFIEQEKERRKLQMQHIVEKEKLVLAVEQEILRVHGRAARALANQSLPYSVCTILKDEEIYNEITPEQEEKDRNARSRYNGRLFLSWLQDVDDKWEKIKEEMLNRHHCEALSLRGIQCMDWEWKVKELGLCEYKASPVIDETCVPLVHVSDDFNLRPS